jgi:penicillin-binding protein 1C
MTRLTGARSAARLARAILMRLEGGAPGDLAEASFPAPEGRVPAELCVLDGRRSAGGCGQTLPEWVPADDLPPLESAVAVAPTHRAWARANAYPVEPSRLSPPGEVSLRIVAPDHNSRIWRNPETPAGLERLALKAVVDPPVPQVVWYVDGEPFSVADPDKPVFWPVTPGQHRFELRLPHRSESARPVRVVVE